MTADQTPVPPFSTPRSPAQIAAIHGANAVTVYDDEAHAPAFGCPYWHDVDGRQVPCVKTAGHQYDERLGVMEHADASDSTRGPWYGVPVELLYAVASAALVETAGGAR